jgi:hypothetical protein
MVSASLWAEPFLVSVTVAQQELCVTGGEKYFWRRPTLVSALGGSPACCVAMRTAGGDGCLMMSGGRRVLRRTWRRGETYRVHIGQAPYRIICTVCSSSSYCYSLGVPPGLFTPQALGSRDPTPSQSLPDDGNWRFDVEENKTTKLFGTPRLLKAGGLP